MLDPQWDYREVQDFAALADLWEDTQSQILLPSAESDLQCQVRNGLQQRLNLPIVDLDSDQSKFFKHHYAASQRNAAVMSTELSIIRQVEGW